jgi:DNA-binding MarR family transcriptional regulator
MKKAPSRREITRFRSQIVNLYRRLRREAQADDRSWARFLLLGAIEKAGEAATPSLLAESERMRSSNLATMLRELEADGLIVRVPDAKDRRKVRVRLTTTGHDLLYDNRAKRDGWLADAVSHVLTPAERAQLGNVGDLLDRIAAYSATKAESV